MKDKEITLKSEKTIKLSELTEEQRQLYETGYEDGESCENYLIHTENKKQIELMCSSFGLVCETKEYDETWSYLTIKSILT